jgi:Glyoxalase-like domain
MQWELDHVFLACPDAATPQKALSDLGIALVDGRIHRGQGTTNVCAFFENAFFELLLPFSDEELRSESVVPLGLRERISWHETGACPFGICFRPAGPLTEQYMPPVEWWPYSAAYLPEGESIPIVTPRNSFFEPLVFLLTRVRTPPPASEHLGARRNLTEVVIQHPSRCRPSPGSQWFARNSSLLFLSGSEFHLELVLDNGKGGNKRQLNSLPLSVTW